MLRRVNGAEQRGADLSRRGDERRAQERGEERKLPPLQHSDPLPAAEKLGTSFNVHGAAPGTHQRPAALKSEYASLTAAQRRRAGQLREGGAVLALYHIEVVEQPFRSLGQRGGRGVFLLRVAVDALYRGITPAKLPQRGAA